MKTNLGLQSREQSEGLAPGIMTAVIRRNMNQQRGQGLALPHRGEAAAATEGGLCSAHVSPPAALQRPGTYKEHSVCPLALVAAGRVSRASQPEPGVPGAGQ